MSPGPTAEQVRDYARQVTHALTHLGLAYTTKHGALVEVSYKSLALAGDRYAVLEVDTNRLPPRVSVPRLETDEVLKHLSAVVGHPVKRLNTVGLTYVIMLSPLPRPRPFPKRIDLPDSPPPGLAYAWPVGAAREGEERWADLLKTGHMLVGGKPGAGKSTFLNAGLVALLRQHGPESLQMVLIDPKSVELHPYSGIPHLALPVATEAGDAARAITWLANEMGRREALFRDACAKHLAGYNAQATERLPLMLAVLDEVTDLVIQWGGPKAAPFLELVRISSKGRAFGIVLCLATQNPKAEILDTLVRENSGLRVAFRVDTHLQSRSILGQPGAEALPAARPGRLATDLDGQGLQVLQGFAVEDSTVTEVISRLRTSAPEVLRPIEVAMVVYARDRLDGAFTIGDVHERFAAYISERQVRNLGQRWEARGWLTPQSDRATPRRLTAELTALVARVAPGSEETIVRSLVPLASARPQNAVARRPHTDELDVDDAGE